jgi:sulfane dehydrogenase subunit SoxC
MITPNGLHFEVTHNGVPDIDPDQHRLVIHGLVDRRLSFSVESLSRYPMTSRISFVECAGNSGALTLPNAVPGTAQSLHGLVSCAEWTGVSLAVLLAEAGVDPKATWLLAEGADPSSVSRSIPMSKAMDDAMIALYQNGERIRPANGYPMRLLVPGFQGNMNVKWLRQLKLTDMPMQTRYETSRYSLLLDDGRAAQYKFDLDAKSVIGALRDFWYRVDRSRQGAQGRSLRRWREKLGRSRALRTYYEQSADAVPYAVALGRIAGCAAKPGDR